MERGADMENMCKEDLMNLIQSTNFTVIELGLYLDTHPECPCGLAAYEDYSELLKKAVKIYERKYEPLSIYGVENDGSWDWVQSPWPWQKGCDC